jgi:hemolysin activation/secretion protein
VARFELREVMRREPARRTRRATSAVARALGTGVSLLGLGGALVAQAQVPPPRPPLLGDPTGRSNEPPPLFEEMPRPIPAPGQLLPPVPPPQPGEPGLLPRIGVFAREIRVVGSTVFTPEQLAAVTAPYTNRQVTAEDLEALRVALTRLYIDRGYVNSGAVLPDQTVYGGVITYQIVEGKLGRTEVKGNRWLRSGYYQERLSLAAGPPLDVQALQERLQFLLEDPRIERLNAELKPGVSPAEAVLDVRVEERFPIKLWFDFDNYEAPSVGAERGIVTLAHQSLTGNGDTLTLSYGRSEGLNPLLEFGYALPFTASDTTFAVQYRRNDLTVIEQPFTPLNVQSNSDIYTVSLRQPVYRTPSTLVGLELIGERSSLDTGVLGEPFSLEPGAVNGQSAVTALRFAQDIVYRTRSQVIAARSRFSVGLDALGSTIHNNDLPDSQFIAWLGQFQWVRQFDTLQPIGIPEAQVIFRSDVQLTNKPLLSVEQIALGGRYSVRGYPQNTLVRDNAFLGSVEARIPIVRASRWADSLELAPFFDYGQGWNTDRPTGNPPNLAAIGIGLRWALTVPSRVPLRSQFEVYWGHPLRQIQTSASALQGNGLYFQLLFGTY